MSQGDLKDSIHFYFGQKLGFLFSMFEVVNHVHQSLVAIFFLFPGRFVHGNIFNVNRIKIIEGIKYCMVKFNEKNIIVDFAIQATITRNKASNS